MKFSTNRKLITCILPKGKGFEVIKHLTEEKGIKSANVSSGRGTGVGKSGGYGTWMEVDILTVVLDEDRADDIFTYICVKAEINRPHAGFVFLGPLLKSTPFVVPALPAEGKK